MWTIKELKSSARKLLKTKYAAVVAVCFIISIFAGEYTLSTDSFTQQKVNYTQPEQVVEPANDITDNDIVIDFFDSFSDGSDSLDESEKITEESKPYVREAVVSVITSVINAVSSNNWIYKAMQSYLEFDDNDIFSAVLFIIISVLSILYGVFIAGVLNVGRNRFFMEARSYKDTPISRIFIFFRLRKKYFNVAKCMFMYNLFLGLWSFTIVMIPIKVYQYSMYPYIVAENPQINWRDAFKLTKQMTSGNKWKIFAADLSFVGWNILTAMTAGLLGIFYVNPYWTAVRTEIYFKLRRNALDKKIEKYECLNDVYIEKVIGDDI